MRRIPGNPTLIVNAQNVKIGDKTRGRGFWAGRDRSHKMNPDVDRPSATPASQLEDDESTSSDGFNDNFDPCTTMLKEQNTRHISSNQLKAAESFYHTYTMSTKSERNEMTPTTMTTQELVEATEVLKGMLGSCGPEDRAELLAQARELAKVIKARLANPGALQKAEEGQPEPAKPPVKAQSKQLNERGKVAYDYGDAPRANKKGPNSDGGLPGVGQRKKDQPDAPADKPATSAPVTPPVTAVDPTQFLALLKITPEKLKAFASKHTKQSFVDWFAKRGSQVSKPENSIMFTPAYLGQLYDTLIAPPPEQPAEEAPAGQPGAGPAPKAPGNATPRMPPATAAKSVKFNWPVVDPKTIALTNRLQKADVKTGADVHKCLKSWFFLTDLKAQKLGNEFLDRWAKMGVITLG